MQRQWSRRQRSFLLTTLFASLFFAVPLSQASAALVGAIRWDGYVGTGVGADVERVMGPNRYHFRAQSFASETGMNSIQIRETTQAVMDQSIDYAVSAGVDYWAIDFYNDGTGLELARLLYDSSTHKGALKHCYIVFEYPTSHPTQSWLVSKFQEPNYQKVLGNRPLLYLFNGTAGYTAADITSLRNATTAVGLGTPYIVIMNQSSSTASSQVSEIGADAISSYITWWFNAGPYSGLVSQDTTLWESHKATGRKVIPWVTTGIDPRPYHDANPQVPWYPTVGPNDWVETATATEVANHLQDGLSWVTSNPTVAETSSVLVYAWNENTEGGWITPTLIAGAERLQAIIPKISPSTLANNLARVRTGYSASSQYANTQPAVVGFDGDFATNWQAASGASYNGSWVEVSFGESVTFDKAVLAELGARTSGYRIEYWNGSIWQTAYTGTTIGGAGSPTTVTFAAKTGTKARIYYTSGTGLPNLVELELYNTNPPVLPTSLVNWLQLENLRNDCSCWVGSKITVGGSALTVSELGRYYVYGNSGTHTVKLVKASDGTDVAGGSVSINMGTGSRDKLGFKYATLGSPVTLAANTSYYLVTQESSGGDYWYDASLTKVKTTGVASVPQAVYGTPWTLAGDGGSNAYGPVNLKYTAGGGSCTGNLAPCATTSSSSTYAGYCDCRINNGLTSDYEGWASADGVMPEWVQLTWGTSQTVGRVEFYTPTPHPARDFQVQYWNGSSWVTPAGGSITGNTQKHVTITFTAVSTTQLRVYVTLGDAPSGWARIDEVEAYAPSGGNPNLSPSASTSSSSTYAGYCDCRINNGLTSDYEGWASADGVMPEWVQLTWGTSQTIGRVEVFTPTPHPIRDFQVQYWNGSSWVTPAGGSITGNTQKQRTVTFTAVSTTQLRVYVTLGDAPSGWARIDEVESYAS